MASFDVSELPNPLTPMAFIPLELAYQFTISVYILVGTLGAYIWDILSNLQHDYKILSTGKVGPATAAYFFSSRRSVYLYILRFTDISAFPLNQCNLAQLLIDICYAIAVPANCLLFFLRARAIFNRNPYLITVFFCLWLSVVGSAFTVPAAGKAGTIGPTKYCTTVTTISFAVSAITFLVHDTTIFLAISLRLFGNAHVDHGFQRNLRAFLTGEYLPSFSRGLLKDGQLYYLSAVTANLVVVAMFYNQAMPDIYRVMFTAGSVMVTNSMAGLVFRNTKLGLNARIMTTSDMSAEKTNTLPMFRRPVRSSITLRGSNTTDEALGRNADSENEAQI
ncbi:hypothetical protein B0H11DRAFT_1733394 [Mycena galericulata]|nr:hypothetical protein B0H11DRAFT_1733394 [Mycena galericulata]